MILIEALIRHIHEKNYISNQNEKSLDDGIKGYGKSEKKYYSHIEEWRVENQKSQWKAGLLRWSLKVVLENLPPFFTHMKYTSLDIFTVYSKTLLLFYTYPHQ